MRESFDETREVGGSSTEYGPRLVVNHRLGGHCLVAGVTVSFGAELGDLRDQPVGTRSEPLGGWTGPNPDTAKCNFDSSAELQITARTGRAAPLPALVTPDYRMDLTVRIDSSGCIPIAATLRFTFVASDFNGSDTVCQVCAL